MLKTWAGGGALSRRGTVLVDARSNTLIISDVQTQIPIIENIVSKIDKKAKQVSIEARVVLANADFTRTLTASLLGGFGNSSTTTAGGTGATSSMSVPAPTVGAPIPIISTTSATSTGFGVASITNFSARYFINAAISAAEERDQAKTISRPTIVTQNNIQGMVCLHHRTDRTELRGFLRRAIVVPFVDQYTFDEPHGRGPVSTGAMNERRLHSRVL